MFGKRFLIVVVLLHLAVCKISRHALPITAIKSLKKARSHSSQGQAAYKVIQVSDAAQDAVLKANKADVNIKIFGANGMLSGVCSGSVTFKFTAGKTEVIGIKTDGCAQAALHKLIEGVFASAKELKTLLDSASAAAGTEFKLTHNQDWILLRKV